MTRDVRTDLTRQDYYRPIPLRRSGRPEEVGAHAVDRLVLTVVRCRSTVLAAAKRAGVPTARVEDKGHHRR